MSEIRVTLTEPITVIDTKLTELIFRTPRGRDLIGLPDPRVDRAGWALLLAAACLTNAPKDTILDLPADEAMRMAQEVVVALGPTIPENSSTDISSVPGAGVTSGS